MIRVLVILILMLPATVVEAKQRPMSIVIAAVDDEHFIFADSTGKLVVFEAQTYCFNVDADDLVLWLEGGPDEFCVSGKFLNTRTREACAVWCP